MATFTLSPDARFPPGTVLKVYAGSSGGKPVSAQVTSSTVASDSTAAFTGLADGTRYVAGTSVAGPFTTFSTDAAASEGDTIVGGLVSFDLIEDVDSGWPARPEGAQSGTWIGWTDPTELMSEFDRFIAIPEPS